MQAHRESAHPVRRVLRRFKPTAGRSRSGVQPGHLRGSARSNRGSTRCSCKRLAAGRSRLQLPFMDIKPQAKAISKSTDQLEKGKYGPIFPKTPACYGFTIIANVKPGRAEVIRAYGEKIE